MDGETLLREVTERRPEMVRIALSGQCDAETVLRSVGGAHRFLAKPCDGRTLVDVIRRACALRELLAHPGLKKVVSSVRSLPSLPSLYLEVVAALKSPDTSVRDVAQIIAKDMAMLAKILQLVNSAFFGMSQPISSPEQAVSILGLKMIKALVLTFQLFSQFDRTKLNGFAIEAVAQHSMATGALARRITLTRTRDRHTLDDALTAGLLHDVGKILLADRLPEEYAEARSLAQSEQRPAPEAETERLGADHAAVGAYLLGLWGLPDAIVEAVAYHHRPSECCHQEFAALTAVHAANAIEYECAGRASDGPPPAFDADYLEALGMTAQAVAWREKAMEMLQQREEAHE